MFRAEAVSLWVNIHMVACANCIYILAYFLPWIAKAKSLVMMLSVSTVLTHAFSRSLENKPKASLLSKRPR